MDPITGPVVLWLLILWYLWAHFGDWFKTALKQQVQARALDTAAAVAGKVGARRWQQRAHDAAEQARKPTIPTGPRTADGQTRAAQDAAAGTGRWRRWARVAWADALAAAAAAVTRAAEARARRNSPHTDRAHTDPSGWRDRWTTWTAWPTGDEPQAPKYATATREDQPAEPAAVGRAPQALDPAPPVNGTGTSKPANATGGQSQIAWWRPETERDPSVAWGTQPYPPAAPASTPTGPINATAERMADPGPASITSGRTSTMPLGIGSGSGGAVATANPGGVAAAESGLSQYINYTGRMGLQCGAAHASILRTLNALGNEAWTGVFADTLKRAAQAMKTAEQEFATANAALISCLDIRGAYNANAGAGERDSVLR